MTMRMPSPQRPLTGASIGSRLASGGRPFIRAGSPTVVPKAMETPIQLLLIEDDDDLRDEIREDLVRRRHDVVALGSAAMARMTLERILSKGELLDAVVCDVNLP